MGYSEVYCHICGISFNIGRIRRPDEPRTAAWSGLGREPGQTYIDDSAKCSGTGCRIVRRRSDRRVHWTAPEPATWSDGGDAGEDFSSDYVDRELEETESYELDTPPESVAGEMVLDFDADGGGDGDVEMRDEAASSEDSRSDAEYMDFIQSLSPGRPQPEPEQEELLPLRGEDNECLFEGIEHELEHIAGPDCTQEAGFSGHRISAEEMRGCCTAQCLVPKPTWWRPEPDDEEFEATADVFLSGLTDLMPGRDWSYPEVFPPRHGCEDPQTDNSYFDTNTAQDLAMPFHPTCLEVFKRASLWRTGHVSIQDLMDWFRLEANFRQFRAFPRDPAVQRGRGQMWRHHMGDEFLAANPCFVPNFGPILRSVVEGQSHETDYHRGAFDSKPLVTTPRSNLADPFACLPLELRLHLLSYLSPKDVGNLRLVSRAFGQLPQSFFHELIPRHMPWLWEAWCELPYSYWVSRSAHELRQEDSKWQEEKGEIERFIDILTWEGRADGANSDAVNILRAKIAARELEMHKSRQSCPVPHLSKSPTDWRRLMTDVATQWGDLKGLRNRARIWKDCEEILDRIERYRACGRMGNGVVVDPKAICAEYLRLAD